MTIPYVGSQHVGYVVNVLFFQSWKTSPNESNECVKEKVPIVRLWVDFRSLYTFRLETCAMKIAKISE